MLPRWLEWLIVIAIPIGLFAILYPAVQLTRNPKGPGGQRIPSDLPVEANRVRHPSGLSIVAPKNWDLAPDFGPDTPFLSIGPRGIPGRRLKSLLLIEGCDEPTLDRFAKTHFQGQPAFDRTEIVRHDTFDDPAWSTYELYLEREGQWWHLKFGTTDELKELPPMIKKYLETVEFPQRAN
ncbi:hypothetical protein ETAA8_15730 [Anatilimnocola aggregata]|uniref:Uncharacterized protein n=1 Tax=Anatilimnocola aggregata TaxID=2528021 RepID=A0A517Y8G9_9BACT|nr:hypothetical protein [Anatilimnocola aggregata]QDU26495.1 hypothetical protein ETAA8_15730 [Anatilimnocola aggregata]